MTSATEWAEKLRKAAQGGVPASFDAVGKALLSADDLEAVAKELDAAAELRAKALVVLEPIVDRINTQQLDNLDEFLDFLRRGSS